MVKKSKKVTEKKDVKKTKVVKKTKGEIEKGEKTDKEIAEQLRNECRNAYGNFQKSWFEFARIVTEVQQSGAWEKLEFETFKEYCLEEFKDLNYGTIIKFIGIMSSKIGKLLTGKIEKEPLTALPAWETCYQLKVSEEKFPKEEVPKLYKDVLERKISVREIRQKIKEVSFNEGVKAKLVDISDDEVFKNAVIVDAEIDESIDELGIQVNACIEAANLLVNGLPVITSKLVEGTDKTVELAELLYDKLVSVLNAYIDRVEELTTLEDVEEDDE